ncbi:MAG: hypothetical protein HXY40_04685 [Chloroflexi bacterium]|nr:hypothetical protein [Chloroflexota bacterium]
MMRTFQTLNQFNFDADSGILYLSASQPNDPASLMALKQEGSYVNISVIHGPIEIALRPRLQELQRVLARLKAVEGMQTARQVGTGQAFLALGLGTDGQLLLRPTIVADAAGHLMFNIALTDAVRARLFEWLAVSSEA